MKPLLLLALALGAVQAEEAKLYLQLGHSGLVHSVGFSPDGRFVMTGSADGTARLWDAESGAELRRFEGYRDAVTSVAFSPDGRSVLTGSYFGRVRLWDTTSGAELRRFESPGPVAFSPDGRFVLTGGSDKTGRLWDAASGAELLCFRGHSASVNSVAFSADGRFVLTGSRDTTARLWDAKKGVQLRRFKGHSDEVRSVAFSRDGRFVLTGSDDKTARLWNASGGPELRRFDGFSDKVNSVTFSPDGRSVLIGSKLALKDIWAGADKTARLLDAATGTELLRFQSHSTSVESVAFSQDGRFVLTDSLAGARMWDSVTGTERRRFVGQFGDVSYAAFSPDGRFVLIDDRLWDGASGRVLHRFVDASVPITFSPDGHFLLTGSAPTFINDLTNFELENRKARLLDATTGRVLRRFVGHSDRIRSVAFSPDGRFVLTGSDDTTARLWDATSGAELHRFEAAQVARGAAPVRRSGRVNSVAFSPDGRFVLTCSDTTARLWDAASGEELRRFEGAWGPIAFSPDGHFVLTGTSDLAGARLWDAATGEQLRRFKSHSASVHSVAFSPDGRFVLIYSADNTLALSDAATGVELRRLDGHSGFVNSVSFSPDGHFVVTGASDGTTRLWNPSTGKWLASLVFFRKGGWAVVDPEGRYDASDPDNTIGLHFVAGLDVIELGQLKQRFYTPGLFARIWRGESLPSVAGLNNVRLVPSVEVKAPAAGATDATVRLTNRGGGIGRVIVKVNGRELAAATRGASIDPNTSSAELKFNLAGAALSPTGKNVIEVFAENADGVIRTRGFAVEWIRDQPQDSPPPRLFAIVAGVSDYDNQALNLRYSAKDAIDFGHALRLAGRGLFGEDRSSVTILASGTSLEPTKQNLRRTFDQIAREAHPSDLLILYLAGHGQAARAERDQYYFLTKEARSFDLDRDRGLREFSTISSAELKEWLGRPTMPLKQVVVLDTCAAGAAFGETVKLSDRRELSPDQVRAIELLKDATGSWILMGSAADAVSYEANRYAQGLLTYALLQGMKGAALDGDQVEVSRLFGYAQRQVQDLARGIGGLQRPILSAPKGQTFPIGLLKEADRREIHLATAKAQLLRARVLDDNDLDALKIEPALRAELRTASLPQALGGESEGPKVAYLDSVVDEVPDALIPQVRYTVIGEKLKVRLRLLQNGKPVSERNLELKKSDAAGISRALVVEIVVESGRVK